MSNLERMGVKLTIPGDRDAPRRKMGVDPELPIRLTHKTMIDLIGKAGITPETKVELIKLVKQYPSNTMLHFYQNIHAHIAKIQSKKQLQNSIKENNASTEESSSQEDASEEISFEETNSKEISSESSPDQETIN